MLAISSLGLMVLSQLAVGLYPQGPAEAPAATEVPASTDAGPAAPPSEGTAAIDLAPTPPQADPEPAPELAPAPIAEPSAANALAPAATAEPAASPEPTPAPAPRVAPPKRTEARSGWPVLPINWRVELMAGGGTSSAAHKSYTFFDDDDRRMQNTNAEVRAVAKLAGPLYMGGGVGYRYADTDHGFVFGRGTTQLQLHEPRALMRFAYEPVQGIDVWGQLGAGLVIADYVTDVERRTDNRSFAFVGDLLVGTSLSMPRKWLRRRGSARVTPGLDFGLGYAYRTGIDIKPTIDLDDDPITTQTPDLGKLQASGFTWRLGIFVRFM